MLDRTGALIGEQRSSCYREGVPTVVVFEISPSHMKIFHYRPNAYNYYQVLSHAVRRLCVGSESELRRPRFVAVTTYRCRVRFRRPQLIIKGSFSLNIIALNSLLIKIASFTICNRANNLASMLNVITIPYLFTLYIISPLNSFIIYPYKLFLLIELSINNISLV